MTVTDLGLVLDTVRERITKYQGHGLGEQDTKATLIVPVLRALGWDTEDLEDVKLEYKRKSTDNPVDYALVLLREPRLFIEAKALGAHLDDHKWANQILAYATVAGVEWVALTDGNEYRLYNSHAIVPVEEKLFRTVRIDDPESRPAETLGLLSKALLQDHLIDQYWKSEFVDRQVGDTLRVLFASEPDPAVIRLVYKKLPTMSRADIKASLARLRPTFDFPVVAPSAAPRGQVSAGRPAATAETPAETSPGRSEPPKAVGAGTPWRHVTLGQLIDAGLIRVPLDVSRHYRGTDLAARIESANHIVYNGTERLADAGAVTSVGSNGDSYTNALAESVNGLYETELIRAKGPWRMADQVELAIAAWVAWWNAERLHGACGDVPLAELEAAYYSRLQSATKAA